MLGPLRFYLENDFNTGSEEVGFNLLQAYGQAGNTYGGYGFSAFVDADSLPDTLDDEGPSGAALLRVAAVRQVFKLAPGLTATLSVEDPSSQIDILPEGSTPEEPMPDIVGALRFEQGWGHVQGAVVARDLGYSRPGVSRSHFGYGLHVSGLAKIEGDFLMAGFTYGDGIARYFNDLGGLGYDAVIEPSGRVRPLEAYGGFVGYTLNWDAQWSSNLVASILMLERDPFLPRTAYRSGRYAAANVIMQASPNFTAGFETPYGRHELQDGRDADDVRLQVSLKYDLVQ